MSLTIQEFNRLPRQERERRYCELSSHDKFLARIGEWGLPTGSPTITAEEFLANPPKGLEFITSEMLDRMFPEEAKKRNKNND